MKALTSYACISERTIRDWMHFPDRPLPASQVKGKLLFRRITFDQWIEAHPYRPAETIDVIHLVDEVLKDFRKAS